MITCTTKAWTWMDVMRGVIAEGFTPDGGSALQARALRMVVVADSGEPYFCSGTRFSGIDALCKELTGLWSGEGSAAAIRVSIGAPVESGLCSSPARAYTPMENFLSLIGKGTDGKPVLRIALND